MRFAYADPPYPGQSKRWYGNHPDYGGHRAAEDCKAVFERLREMAGYSDVPIAEV